MGKDTKIKAVLYTLLLGEAGGDKAVKFSWDRFSQWAFDNLPVEDMSESSAVKIVVVIALGIYLVLRDPKGQRRLSGADIATIKQVMRDLGSRNDPTSPGKTETEREEPKR